MSRVFAKLRGFFTSKTLVGVDKVGNRYFTRKEHLDGLDSEGEKMGGIQIRRRSNFYTSAIKLLLLTVVEWICWLNGQRKRAPSPEEMAELEALRERVKLNVALLREEEVKRLANAGPHPRRTIGKDASPDLKNFIKQFPNTCYDQNRGSEEESGEADDERSEDRTSEPTGSGSTFKPGTWQPPS